MRTFTAEIASPSEEDWEGWQRVCDYWAYVAHVAAMSQGRYEIHMESDEPPYVVTDEGREELTKDLARRLGWSIVIDGAGEIVGYMR